MYYFAWCSAEEEFDPDVHATQDTAGVGRLDEDIFEYLLEHGEGQFASLTLMIANPGEGLFAEGRERWAFFAEDIDDVIVCRGKFQLLGVPDGLQHEEIVIKLIAQPADFEEQKAAVAAAARLDAQFYDPVCIVRDELDHPDAVRLARPASWHVDPVTHVVTLSDNIAGEDGLIAFTADEIFYDGRDLRLGQVPARRFELTAEIRWTQRAAGTFDISRELLAAFNGPGSDNPFMIGSYTAQGLVDDWPLPGDKIGAGWFFADTNIETAVGRWVTDEQAIDSLHIAWVPDQAGFTGDGLTSTQSIAVDMSLGVLKPTIVLGYDVARSYVERVTFTLEADVQQTLASPGDAEVIRLSIGSNDVGEPIDPGGTAGPELPIGDVRRRTYMGTDRGKKTAQYFGARARASLLDRARCVSIPFDCVYERLVDVTLRKSAAISDPALPGGAAQGKIVGWRETGNGDTGEANFGLVIACCVGNGGSVAASAGTGVYAAPGYMAPGYQAMTGRTILVAGDVTLADYSVTPNDDGVDLLTMGPRQAITSLTVENTAAQQKAQLGTHYADESAAAEALQAVFTQVCLDLVKLTGGPFETDVPLSFSQLKVPKGIDLTAPAN